MDACFCVRVSLSHYYLSLLSETCLSVQCSIPSQIRDLTFGPSYSSAAGQCETAPVTQLGKEAQRVAKGYK